MTNETNRLERGVADFISGAVRLPIGCLFAFPEMFIDLLTGNPAFEKMPTANGILAEIPKNRYGVGGAVVSGLLLAYFAGNLFINGFDEKEDAPRPQTQQVSYETRNLN